MKADVTKTRNIVAVLAASALLSLAGCGFHPMYGPGIDGKPSKVVASLNNVSIENIPDRNGQILRNFLVDRMYGAKRPDRPAYRLKVSIQSSEEDLGILANATATRALLNMYGKYVLLDANGKELLRGTAHSVAGFDRLDQMYGTVAARKDAHERSLKEVSEQIVNSLTLYFSEGR